MTDTNYTGWIARPDKSGFIARLYRRGVLRNTIWRATRAKLEDAMPISQGNPMARHQGTPLPVRWEGRSRKEAGGAGDA